MSGLAVSGVWKRFGADAVLEDLDLEVADGAMAAVLGESGSGKTTLLRLVAGFERPDRGTIRIGESVVDSEKVFVAPERRRIGYVAQEGALFPHLTVARNIGFGLTREQRRGGRVADLLELVGLVGLGGRYPHELSGGQQQRVALARALAPSPTLVLLDEPFSALDPTLRASLRADVMRILRREGVTAILVTHDQEEALSVADVVGVIRHGRIGQLGPPAELYARPADAGLAGFLGEANLLQGTVQAGVVRTVLGELRLAREAGDLEGVVTVLVRPEQVSLTPRPDGSGEVLQLEYYGHDSVLLVSLASLARPVRVRVGGRPPARVGDRVVLSASGETVAWAAEAGTAPGPAVP